MSETEEEYQSTPEDKWLDKRIGILAKDPRLNPVPDSKYLELFWEAMGFWAGTALAIGLDELSMTYLHSLLDRLELEVL